MNQNQWDKNIFRLLLDIINIKQSYPFIEGELFLVPLLCKKSIGRF